MAELDFSASTATRRNAMTRDEIAAFLQRPITAAVATICADGIPHLTPIWFGYEDGRFFLLIGARRRHLRNLRRDPRATLLVDVDDRRDGDGLGEAKAVMVSGAVTLVEEPDSVQHYSDELELRYLGTTEPIEGAPTGEEYVLAWLDPSRWMTWDFAKAQADASAPASTEETT